MWHCAHTKVRISLRLASVFVGALQLTQGNIVMVNSAVLWQSQPEFAAYKLTKGAMLHMAGFEARLLEDVGKDVHGQISSRLDDSTFKMD